MHAIIAGFLAGAAAGIIMGVISHILFKMHVFKSSLIVIDGSFLFRMIGRNASPGHRRDGRPCRSSCHQRGFRGPLFCRDGHSRDRSDRCGLVISSYRPLCGNSLAIDALHRSAHSRAGYPRPAIGSICMARAAAAARSIPWCIHQPGQDHSLNTRACLIARLVQRRRSSYPAAQDKIIP